MITPETVDQLQQLAEAIRHGSALRPQVYGAYYRNGGSCALGAAAEALGVPYGQAHLVEATLSQHYPDALTTTVTPASADTVRDMIVWANDRARRSREEIADVLEALARRRAQETSRDTDEVITHDRTGTNQRHALATS